MTEWAKKFARMGSVHIVEHSTHASASRCFLARAFSLSISRKRCANGCSSMLAASRRSAELSSFCQVRSASREGSISHCHRLCFAI